MSKFLMETMRLLNALISVYTVVLIVRIFLTWFPMLVKGRLFSALVAVTDPYLNFFRRFRWLRVGAFDLSPVLAITILMILGQVARWIAVHGRVTFSVFLWMLMWYPYLWSSFLLGFFCIVIVVRWVTTFFSTLVHHPLWAPFDDFVAKAVARITAPFRKGPRRFSQRTELCLLGCSLVVVYHVVLYMFSLFMSCSIAS